MRLTGENLYILSDALDRAIEAVHTDIGHLQGGDAGDVQVLAQEVSRYRWLRVQVKTAIKKEQSK